MVTAIALLLLATASVLLALGIEPVPTWFYVFAWYPTLVILDGAAASRGGHRRLLAHPARAAVIGGWSVVIWLVFEAANFRLMNWYYVFLPAHPVERWTGIALSFATVVPAVLLMERWLCSIGIGRTWRMRPLRPAPGTLPWIQVLGCAMAIGALLLPEVLFPLIWGAAWLIADPMVYRRRPEWSLLADIEAGRWGRVGRLLVGGLLIGLLWELFNGWARGKWIYTVPWLEQTKLFEMPPLGFLGFPFFALEAWSMFHILRVLGLAPAPTDVPAERGLGAWSRGTAVIAALAFAVATLLGMERLTISSVIPQLADLPTATPSEVHALRAAGYHSVFALAAADPLELTRTGPPALPEAGRLVSMAGLVSLRGIGTEHASQLADIGVRSVCQLARRSPGSLWTALQGVGEPERVRPTPAEVRVWIGAARRDCVEHTSIPLANP